MPTELSPSWSETHCPDELVDLAVSLSVDHSPGLAFNFSFDATTDSGSLVAVFERFDVSKVTSESV